MNKLIICLIISFIVISCESVSYKTDKVEVETEGKKVVVEGVELETKKTR